VRCDGLGKLFDKYHFYALLNNPDSLALFRERVATDPKFWQCYVRNSESLLEKGFPIAEQEPEIVPVAEREHRIAPSILKIQKFAYLFEDAYICKFLASFMEKNCGLVRMGPPPTDYLLLYGGPVILILLLWTFIHGGFP
jgi:hypothetical protein